MWTTLSLADIKGRQTQIWQPVCARKNYEKKEKETFVVTEQHKVIVYVMWLKNILTVCHQ